MEVENRIYRQKTIMFTRAQEKEIQELWQAGQTLLDIGQKYNCSRIPIKRVLNKKYKSLTGFKTLPGFIKKYGEHALHDLSCRTASELSRKYGTTADNWRYYKKRIIGSL